jgi:hypothetical protein
MRASVMVELLYMGNFNMGTLKRALLSLERSAPCGSPTHRPSLHELDSGFTISHIFFVACASIFRSSLTQKLRFPSFTRLHYEDSGHMILTNDMGSSWAKSGFHEHGCALEEELKGTAKNKCVDL